MDELICTCGHTRSGHFDQQDRPCRDAKCGCPGFRLGTGKVTGIWIDEAREIPDHVLNSVEEIIRGEASCGKCRIVNDVIEEAEKAPPAPATESVWERARNIVNATCAPRGGFVDVEILEAGSGDALMSAIDAGEKAEARVKELEAENKLLRDRLAPFMDVDAPVSKCPSCGKSGISSVCDDCIHDFIESRDSRWR